MMLQGPYMTTTNMLRWFLDQIYECNQKPRVLQLSFSWRSLRHPYVDVMTEQVFGVLGKFGRLTFTVSPLWEMSSLS